MVRASEKSSTRNHKHRRAGAKLAACAKPLQSCQGFRNRLVEDELWRRDRDAEGADSEAPMSPSPLGVRSGEGLCPLPRKFFSIFELKNASFGAFWVLFLQLN